MVERLPVIFYNQRDAFRCSVLALLGCCLMLPAGGCSAFNPAFLSLVPGYDAAAVATIPNSPGHVVVTLVNNAEVAEQVITCLKSADCGCLDAGEGNLEGACEGLSLTDAQERALKPRIRLRVRITFADGNAHTVEFVDGSREMIKPNSDALELDQVDRNTRVVMCDVASVEIVNPIEVFIPIVWSEFEQIDPTENAEAFTRTIRQENPRYYTLEVDDVDDNLITVLRRNIALRDAPATVDDPLCGSVVAITVNGTLGVPFFEGRPGFDGEDDGQRASVGGRFDFVVAVK